MPEVLKVVKAPVLGVVAPIVPLKAPEAYVPPVIVLPVKVNAAGKEITGLPTTPSPLVTVTSAAVPVIVLPE